MSNLTLWDIEDSIVGLSEIIESPDASEEEKAAARAELERWTRESIAKVDRVRDFLRHCAVMADAAKAEADAMRKRGQQWEERGRRLKEICIAVMQHLGKKRLEGQTGTLRIQAAGGKRALTITREDLLPESLVRYTISISGPAYAFLKRLIADAPQCSAMVENSKREPDTEAIRKVLETPCAECDGSGDGEQMQADGSIATGVPGCCVHCNGSGHMLVPGAELEPRKDTLRVS